MVQRKVPNKLGIKPLHLKLDSQLLNLKPSSPSSPTHEKLKKIMKKSRPIKRANESQSPPIKKKKTLKLPTDVAVAGVGLGLLSPTPAPTPATPQKQSPNYMKSTSSFEARKEQSPKTPISKGPKSNCSNSSGSKTSSLKMVRSLTKTPSFKLSRSSQKVIFCEDGEAQRATCSSTLKGSKFPKYLQLNSGGTELEGTSSMKVCPYTYCSLNGHHHAPVPPLKKFLAARRRSLKTQNSFKLGCLSPRQRVKKINVKDPVISAPEEAELKEENTDFFIDVCSNNMGSKIERDLEYSDIDWEEGYCSDSGDNDLNLQEIETDKTSGERLYDEEIMSYDEDSASDRSCQRMKIDQDHLNYDEFEVSSSADELGEIEEIDCPIGDQNVNNQKEESYHESKSTDDFGEKSKDSSDENRTTVIYNIVQINISVFINGERREDNSEMDKIVTVGEPATSAADGKMGTEEAMEEENMSNEDDEGTELNRMIEDEEPLKAIEKEDSSEQECNEYKACSQFDSIEEPAIMDQNQTHETEENSKSTGNKKQGEETGDDLREFNPRGPNFLAEIPEPAAETVDLKHQMMDERKNAEEWMVDFALQQAVTKLAPARNRKVALLVEAFEKVMPDPIPIPRYKAHNNRYSSKAFTNARPMQACS